MKKQALKKNKKAKSGFSKEEKIEFLKIEMQMLQGRFDKYDDLIHRNRNWFNALLVIILGVGISKNPELLIIGIPITIFFYAIELIWRIEYWYQYVVRFRFLRDFLNSSKDIDTISVYDLSNKYGEKIRTITKILDCIKNVEMTFFYSFWVVFYICFHFFFQKG